MFVDDIIRASDGPTFSFEFFPPRDQTGIDRLTQTVQDLSSLNPDWVSVTYGANGSSRQRTFDATIQIQEQTDVTIVGHLTCTGQTIDELKAVIDGYGDAGITTILAIRGDMPGGASVPWEQYPGGLANATQLVELIRSRGDYCVGVGAFPDGHAEATLELDAHILKAKQDAGASFAVTQLFFEASKYHDLVARAEGMGVTMPIIGGIMPITSVRQLGKFAELSQAPIPPYVAETLLAAPDDPASVRTAGSQIAAQLCRDLLDGRAPGLQFFTQNRSVATRQILSMLRETHPA